MESYRAAKMKEYYESDRKHIKNLVRRFVAKLKDDHDASMLVMGSKTEVKEMQGPEHPHTSGDASMLVMGSNTSVLQGQDTGDADVRERQVLTVDRSSGESERTAETHANLSGYEQNSRAPGSSR